MAFRIVYSEAASLDADDIYDWIAGKADPETAAQYLDRVLDACEDLCVFPNRGTSRDDLADGVRTIAFERRATIAYRVSEETVTILRILHHGRDHQSAFPH